MRTIFTGMGILVAAPGTAFAQAEDAGRSYLAVGFAINRVDDEGLLSGDDEDAAAAFEEGLELGSGGDVIVDSFGVGDNATITSVNFLTGFEATEFFGIEVEGFAGLAEDDILSGAGTIDGEPFGARIAAKLDYGVTGFVKAKYPLNDWFSVHARVGYGVYGASARVKADSGDIDEEISDSGSSEGVAYGAGFEYRVRGNNAIRADYTRYDPSEFDDGGVDSFALFYVRRF